MKRYFITGTDTDCGKTYATTELLHYFAHSAAIKPIASGCSTVDGHLINSDALSLQQLQDLTMDVINPWRFNAAVSPHLAANLEGRSLNVSDVVNYCLNLNLPRVKRLFIEGAGGLMVPLNDQETWMDFLRSSRIPVILVVGMRLGCINHALLTDAVLKMNQIECVGWIANCHDPEMMLLDENIITLKNHLKIPLLATIPYMGFLNNHHLDKI
ncbi:MAG: dethiobiotin synthase [Legionella sp.]|nr:dethiobiotin synthase [Legionella sp.]